MNLSLIHICQPDGGYTIEQESAGSGIIIGQSDDELLICTNNHVVEGATEITVGFVDNEIYEAVVKGTDAGNDLACLLYTSMER